MLQRIQTVFLSITGLCLAGGLYGPLWEKIRPAPFAARLELNAFALVYTKGDMASYPPFPEHVWVPVWVMAILWSASLVLSFVIVSRYRHRRQQMQLCGLNFLLIAGALLLAFYFSHHAEGMLAPDAKGRYLWGTYLLLSALIFNWLARIFILRDERKVQSAESLR